MSPEARSERKGPADCWKQSKGNQVSYPPNRNDQVGRIDLLPSHRIDPENLVFQKGPADLTDRWLDHLTDRVSREFREDRENHPELSHR